jgi:hypothetical protein
MLKPYKLEPTERMGLFFHNFAILSLKPPLPPPFSIQNKQINETRISGFFDRARGFVYME